MVTIYEIGAAISVWAQSERSIEALILIGSRVRAAGPLAADARSDWDFQVVARRTELFGTSDWLSAAGLGPVITYVVRTGRFGNAKKISAILRGGELDLVIIPSRRLQWARWLLACGLVQRSAGFLQGLTDLAVVLRPGHRFLKGEVAWGHFFASIVAQLPALGIDDSTARSIADGFVCDYLSTRHKIARGELLAAQRWLHHQLAETNFRLLHELRLRRAAPSLPDARRLEFLADPATVSSVAVNAVLTQESLLAATERAAETCRQLMRALVADAWRWPDLSEADQFSKPVRR